MSAPSLPLPNLGTWLVKDLCYRALRAAQIVKRAQGIPSSSQFQEALGVLNQIVDEWTARKPFAWATTFTQYTLTPYHQPHLIGPGLVAPDFAAAVRPVRIESAELVLTGFGPPPVSAPNVNTNVDLPLNLRDSAWWANKSVKGISSTVPTDLYYESDWDSGALWLWPVPAAAFGLRLETWVTLSQFQSINVKFSAPPAYFNALAYTLARALVDAYEVAMPGQLPILLRDAMKAIQGNNVKSPRIASADWGTDGNSRRGDFNYMTGTLPSY
jgi:hypothetical protein